MSVFTERVYADGVRTLLPDGERLLLVVGAGEPVNASTADLRRAAGTGPDVDPGRRPWVLGFDPLHGGVQWNLERVDRGLWRSSGSGGPGTAAARIWAALDGTAPARPTAARANLVAVTDARLLVLHADPGGVALLVEVGRGEVLGVRRRGSLGARGRVEVAFADGSVKAISFGMFRTRYARRVVAALSDRTAARPA